MIKSVIKKALKLYYKEGGFYKIPFGPNRGLYFEYEPSMILGIMLGIHEPNTFQAFSQLLRKGMTVVDLGANRGYFSIYFAKMVGNGGVVYAFEPMPDNYAALERTIHKNNFQNIIKPVQAAVYNRNETVEFFQSENHLMSSVDVAWAGSTHGKIEVSGITLDSFFEDKKRGPDLIKMDIEGGGTYALEGMEEVIKKYKPYLLLESHTPAEDKAIGRILAIGDYVVFRVGDSTEVKDLTADHTNPQGVYGTVLGVPKDDPSLKNLKPDLFQKYRFGQR